MIGCFCLHMTCVALFYTSHNSQFCTSAPVQLLPTGTSLRATKPGDFLLSGSTLGCSLLSGSSLGQSVFLRRFIFFIIQVFIDRCSNSICDCLVCTACFTVRALHRLGLWIQLQSGATLLNKDIQVPVIRQQTIPMKVQGLICCRYVHGTVLR